MEDEEIYRQLTNKERAAGDRLAWYLPGDLLIRALLLSLFFFESNSPCNHLTPQANSVKPAAAVNEPPDKLDIDAAIGLIFELR